MRKKAQGLSVNVIIIAAIALIVLVVLVAIFTGRLGIFSKGLGETTDCNQLCIARGYAEGIENDAEQSGYTKLLGARGKDGYQCWCK